MPETGQSSQPNGSETGKSEIGKSASSKSASGKSASVKSGVSKSATSQALKNLRAFAIVTVVSFHSVLAYLASQPHAAQPFDSPPFHWIATPILDSQRWLGFDIYAAFQYVSLMPVMFFLSGIFVWSSLKRKGSWNYLSGRILRIGVPFLLGVYLLMPFAYYPVYRVGASDPSLLSYFKQLVALPFWPSGPLWFLWQLLVFDCAAVAIFLTAPRLIEKLGRLSTSASETPKQYFLLLLAVSAAAYLPLAFVFGPSSWRMWGPFALQSDRFLLYLVYFFAGVGVGVEGFDRGLLRPDGVLSRRWYIWAASAIATFLLWMMSMAPAVYGHSNFFIDTGAYFAVVLAVACACLGLAAIFLRFAHGRWAVADSLAEHAYTIYLVHYVFVVWMQYSLLDAALPAIAKGVIVLAVSLLLSWAVAAGIGRLPWRATLVRARSPAPGSPSAIPHEMPHEMRPTGAGRSYS
jgi:peptidoglycan/LPS O-acetylase OafA/YrhL